MSISDFRQMAAAAMLYWYNLTFLWSEWRRASLCQIWTKWLSRDVQEGRVAFLCQILSPSVEPRPRYGYFHIVQNGGRRRFGFSKFKILNGWNGQLSRIAPACQISWKSVEPRPRYGYFQIFQHGGRRHLGFSKFHTFNGRNGQGGRTALACQI